MTPLTFTVFGIAQPQGSSKAFMPRGARFPVVTSDNPKVKGWRQQVAEAAGRALEVQGGQQARGPVRVVAEFFLPRPKSLKKPTPHLTRPDVDKLARACGDAMTGVVYADDSQVVQLCVSKYYAAAGEAPHAVIAVTSL